MTKNKAKKVNKAMSKKNKTTKEEKINKWEKKINKWKEMKSEELLSLFGKLNRLYGGVVRESKIEKIGELRNDINLLEDILRERLLRKPNPTEIFIS